MVFKVIDYNYGLHFVLGEMRQTVKLGYGCVNPYYRKIRDVIIYNMYESQVNYIDKRYPQEVESIL